MPISDQPDDIVVNRAIEAIIENLRNIPNTDAVLARDAQDDQRARIFEDIQAYDKLADTNIDQRRWHVMEQVKAIAVEEGCWSAMEARIDQCDVEQLYATMERTFVEKMTDLKRIRDEFFEESE